MYIILCHTLMIQIFLWKFLGLSSALLTYEWLHFPRENTLMISSSQLWRISWEFCELLSNSFILYAIYSILFLWIFSLKNIQQAISFLWDFGVQVPTGIPVSSFSTDQLFCVREGLLTLCFEVGGWFAYALHCFMNVFFHFNFS